MSRREKILAVLLVIARVAGIAALTLDGLYTLVYWLILGRNERRTKRHAELRYFGIIAQLSAEIALIWHLARGLKEPPERG